MNSRLWAPCAGVAFLVVLIVAFIVGGQPPDASGHSSGEIVNWYQDHKSSVEFGGWLGMIAALLVILYGAYLRRVFAERAGVGGVLSVLPLVGVAIVGTAAAIDATIQFAIAEFADSDQVAGSGATSVQALSALYDNDFLPFLLGVEVFLLSMGLLILKTGVLPRWMGWVVLLFFVVGLIPAGPSFAAVPFAALLILVTSVIFTRRARDETPGTQSTPSTA